MSRGSFITGIAVGAIIAAAGFIALSSMGRSSSPEKKLPPPADIAKIVKEEQLNIIHLRPEAVDRLGLTTATIEKKPMPRTRFYGGEVMVPLGRTAVVSAPFSGIVRSAGKEFPQPGRPVKTGQVLFDLLPILTPEGRASLAASKIDAEGQVRSAESQVAAAKIAMERAERVLKAEAGSKKAVDDARAQYDLAVKAVEAATARTAILDKIVGDNGQVSQAPITSPEDGVLRAISVFPGQNVPAGAPLFEVVDLGRVWVRTPVFVGDLASIRTDAPAKVGPVTADASQLTQVAKRADAPPSANAVAGTVDLFYELDNSGGKLSPGERVATLLTLAGDGESLVAPWAAVVHDIHGNGWVYEDLGKETYARRPVMVRFVEGPSAVLAAGPKAGTRVVVDGAMELFGAETGFTK